MLSLTSEIISKAESYDGIQAGLARLDDVLNAPSYKVVPNGEWSPSLTDNGKKVVAWPAKAKTVLVLGLHHPEKDPRLDWWYRGNTLGNRLLMGISDRLKKWLETKHGLPACPLPYHLERGGLFLKDAAALAGLGIIGKSNLFLNPRWGPQIRLRAILVEGEIEPTANPENFSPCDSCDQRCHLACPANVFTSGSYDRPRCIEQLNIDIANKAPDGPINQDGKPEMVIKYCRVCELACPAGS